MTKRFNTIVKRFLVIDVVLTFILILMMKYTGFTSRSNFAYYEPYSWSEIFILFPKALIYSSVISFLISLYFINIERQFIKANKLNQDKLSEKEKKGGNSKTILSHGNHKCRICGFHNDYFPWGENGEKPNFELCPCCGVQFGKEDVTLESIQKYRKEWLRKGGKWFIKKDRPENWDIDEQMRNIPEDFI